MERPSWDEYFMAIAFQVAQRSTCNRKQVGALIVRDHDILATGYNGSVAGMRHCTDAGCDLSKGEQIGCIRTIHAEANALIRAARNGVGILGAELYTTASPCLTCFKLVVNAGIKRISYCEEFRETCCFQMAELAGVQLRRVG